MSTTYEEMIVSMEDLQDGDQVLGPDGNWYDVEILPIHTPKTMYKMHFAFKIFENMGMMDGRRLVSSEPIGFVKCSGDHEWTLFDHGIPFVLKTDDIFDNLDFIQHLTVGKPYDPNGDLNLSQNIYVESMEQVEPEPCRCVTMKGSEDMQFQILLETEDFEIDEALFDVERN